MGTLSVRISEEIEKDLKDFAKDEKLEQPSDVARKLLMIALEKWRINKALKLLEDGRISFLRAAKFARLNVWEFSDLIRERKLMWIKDNSVKEDIEKALA